MSSVGKRTSSRSSSSGASASTTFGFADGSSVCELMGLSGDGSDSVMWVVRAVLVVYAAFVASNLPSNVTWLFDNTVARLVVVMLILALAVCDPASAILLTIGFVLSIQAANKQHISKLANVASTTQHPETFMARAVDHRPTDARHAVGSAVSSVGHAVGGVGHAVGSAVGDAGHAVGSAVGSVGHAIRGGHPSPHHQSHHFTPAKGFHDVQSNTVQDNQNTEVRTWQNEMGPQGLTEPSGFAFADSGCSPAPVQ